MAILNIGQVAIKHPFGNQPSEIVVVVGIEDWNNPQSYSYHIVNSAGQVEKMISTRVHPLRVKNKGIYRGKYATKKYFEPFSSDKIKKTASKYIPYLEELNSKFKLK